MTACARGTTWIVGLAAGLLSLLAHASFVWQVDGQMPMRIDIATAATHSAVEPGPVDAIVPLGDGGAWLRRGSELVRLTPDLRVAARANVALAGPMHWESQSRRLWVLGTFCSTVRSGSTSSFAGSRDRGRTRSGWPPIPG